MAFIIEWLAQLHTELIRMGALCEDCIAAAVKGFLSGDAALCRKTERIEQEINQQERSIEALCMKILLRQQPVAGDLRAISSALKMISDMERIGDQSFEIAALALVMQNSSMTGKTHIREMALAATKMVTNSIEAFIQQNVAIAQQVIQDDDAVDEGFNQVKREIIALLADDPAQSEYAVDLLMIAKYLERIGDHAVNIAEWVVYAITGVHTAYAAEGE